MSPDIMQSSETMSKLVCRSSKLKSDLYRNDGDNRTYCDMCQDFALENAEHLVIHSPYFKNIREHIFLDLSEIERSHGVNVFTPTENNFHLVMGKVAPGVNYDIAFEMYRKIASSVHLMYSVLVKARKGVG